MKINKKGVLGLSTVKMVILALLTLAVLAIAVFAVLLPMRDTFESVDTHTTSVVNETTTDVVTGTGIQLAGNAYRNCVATVTEVKNETAVALFGSGNYSTSGCKISATLNSMGNNSKWNVTYSYTWDNAGAYDSVGNIVNGTTSFFAYTPTFMVLLAVVVLILIIAVVIVAVSRFGAGGMIGGGKSELAED